MAPLSHGVDLLSSRESLVHSVTELEGRTTVYFVL